MPACQVIAVGGHESDGGRALRGTLGDRARAVSGGRQLLRSVRESRANGTPVCVVPMTLGRDPELVADAARTLLALTPAERSGVVLAEPFGTTEHLTGWLRAAAARVPADRALLVTAPAGDPFTDADLFRVARLTRQYGRHRIVEVAFTGGDPDPAEGVRRCRALGAGRVALLPAAWTLPALPGPGAVDPGEVDPGEVDPGAVVPGEVDPGAVDPGAVEETGPLLAPSAVAGVLAARVGDAWRRHTEHGADGLAEGLAAAHDHGHNHTHPPGDDPHRHGHGHAHDHQHDHGHGHGHPHPHGAHHHGIPRHLTPSLRSTS